MKISKSKVTLAAKIKSSGFEWPQFGKWATQDKDGEVFISGGEFTPVRRSGEVNWCFDVPYKSAGKVEFGVGWFQCILSRAEYFHLYPAPDADGWVEWNGGTKSPAGEGALVDVKMRCGREHYCQLLDDECWSDVWGDESITAYRLHKPEQAKPEFCESVMRSIPEPTTKPTIEQLAADYRNAKDCADRKQQEADDARADADERLKALEIAGEALGLLVSPITAKQEPELVITDWRDLRVGDVIWVGGTIVTVDEPEGECEIIGENIYSYASGLRMFLQPFLVRRGDVEFRPDLKCRGWRFIRRP